LDEAHGTDGLGLDAREAGALAPHSAAGVHQLGLQGGVAGEEALHVAPREGAVGTLHEAVDRLVAGAAGADDLDDVVDGGDGVDQTDDDVLALLRLAQLELGAAPDDLDAVVDVVLDELLEAQRAGLAVDQRDVVDGEGLLEW